MRKQQTIAIIGGSGFVGRALVRQSIAAGYRVQVGCRHPQRVAHLQVDGAELRRVNIATGSGVAQAVQGADIVVNLVGLLFEHGSNTFQAAHIDGTAALLKACQDAGIKRFIQMSALGADIHSESIYARSKAQAEALVRQSGLQWTIFRPSVIYGNKDSFLCRFKALSALGPIFPVVAPETKLQPVWIEDVTRAFTLSYSDRTTANQTYALAGNDAYSMMEIIKMITEQLGRKRLLLPLPNLAAKAMAMGMQLLPTPLLTPDQLILLQKDNVVADGEPFPARLGQPQPFTTMLPLILSRDEVDRLQDYLDAARRQVSEQA
ncbi:MAG: complex I NDUFA9 subunit family protein [Mariprofundales bacterium]